ncbi:transcriptional regulator [Lactobacillus selangorensis]|uniref:Transcriptional regulator n=1 Tax=Lactobacillus selangorensis TaxID=81857 RepID=A0A0R2FJ94_9LACO|nr:WYL domain-containing protein [Lactobacillus selangorensis]KRN28735.1 transcriptional regulator [Lactobacillus selangorensis]KRN32855.1 transcriptional regulator [Lactobacillus selangorensis]
MKRNSNDRIADLIGRLLAGQTVSKKGALDTYGISSRTFLRDMAYIKRAINEYRLGKIVNQQEKYYLFPQSDAADFDIALLISNILLGSRALTTNEMNAALKFVKLHLSPQMQRSLEQQLKIPYGSYTPLWHLKPLFSLLHEMAACIAHKQEIAFTYFDPMRPDEQTVHISHGQPVTLFFETYYFYVTMLSQNERRYQLYRLDQTGTILTKQNGKKIAYANHYSLQDHRQQTYLVNTGQLTTISFVYRKPVQAIHETFPNAQVLETYPNGNSLVKIRVKSDGALIWILGQGTDVQVISPPSIIQQLRTTLKKAYQQYSN